MKYSLTVRVFQDGELIKKDNYVKDEKPDPRFEALEAFVDASPNQMPCPCVRAEEQIDPYTTGFIILDGWPEQADDGELRIVVLKLAVTVTVKLYVDPALIAANN